MRVAVLALAVTAALSLSGCDKVLSVGSTAAGSDGATVAAPRDAAKFSLDQPVRGEITTTSGINYSDGSRHQLYALALDKDQAVTLTLDGALDGALAVFNGDALVAVTEGNGESDTALAFRATTAGDYVVAVSGNSATAFGPYTLQGKALDAYDGAALAAGSEIVDWLMQPRQDYTLQADKAGLYTVSLASTAFDTVLDIAGPGVESNNDDGGDGTNSRLRLYLEPGNYTLTASALEGQNGKGDFTLGVQFSEVPGDLVRTDGTVLTSGQTVHGELSANGQRRFALDIATATTVHLDARSDDVDAVLRVTGPSGSFDDDDGGNGTNARMALELQPGRYEVTVSSLNDSTGMFELETRLEGGSARPQRADNIIAPPPAPPAPPTAG